jgi:pilus assembly protein Flp/PilA
MDVRQCINRFLRSEEGPTATEYAVMLALIIIVAIGAISGIGVKVSDVFTGVDSGLPSGSGS